MKTTLRIYVQNWRNVTRKSDVELMKAAFEERFCGAFAPLSEPCKCQVIEFRPNFATPQSYQDVMRDDAWHLWSSVIVDAVVPSDSDAELRNVETVLRQDFNCAVHVETTEMSSPAQVH